MKKNLSTLIGYFARGLMVVVPLAFTAYVIYNIFSWTDSSLSSFIGKDYPGLGVLIIFLGIAFIGKFATGILLQPVLNSIDYLLEKTPGVKIIYGSIKDMMNAFLGDKKKFTDAVIVEFAGEDIYRPGFITKKDIEGLGIEGVSAVYFPHSYAIAGVVLIVKNNKIKSVDVNSANFMQLIISGGVVEIDKEK